MSFFTGNVKFNVEVKNWKFCTGATGAVVCKQGDLGEFLDFDVIIKGKAESKKDTGMENKYDLGSGSVILSKKVSMPLQYYFYFFYVSCNQ